MNILVRGLIAAVLLTTLSSCMISETTYTPAYANYTVSDTSSVKTTQLTVTNTQNAGTPYYSGFGYGNNLSGSEPYYDGQGAYSSGWYTSY